VQCGFDQLRHAIVVDCARLARTGIVVEPGNSSFNEARAPLAHRRLGQLQALGDRIVRLAVGAADHQARTLTHR
jgi:hypothetical protein